MSDLPSLSGDRPVAQTRVRDDEYIQPNLGHGLRIWWAIYWRTTVLNSISYIGPSIAFHLIVPSYWSYSFNYLAALVMMYFIFARKRFRNFRIRFVSRDDRARVLEPSFRRVLRVWWTFTWRSVVYRIVLSFAMSVPMAFVSGAVTLIYAPLGQAFAILVGLAVDAAVGLFVIYSNIQDEEFSDFCVTLSPNDPPVPSPDSPIASPAPGI